MSVEEENKVTLRRFYELFNQKKFDACNELISPKFVSHRTTGDILAKDMANNVGKLLTAFPDMKLSIEQMVAEGDKVAFREIIEGTYKGEFMDIAPTGKKFKMINACILKIIDGKWAEAWTTMDELNLMQQLGVIPK
jgi:predicted ester cyclase